MRTILRYAAVAALVGSMSGAAGAADLTGRGEWRSLSGEGIGGTWTVALTRSGESVEGELTLEGSNVFRGGTVRGTVDGTDIVLGVLSEQGKTASFAGQLDGGEVKGEWTAALVDDHGVWFGRLGAAAAEPK